MKKVLVVNCADNKDSVCFLSGKNFKTSKGVAYMLNGRIIAPEEGLKSELEFDPGFVIPPNFNTRQKVAEYLTGLGIGRNHQSYISVLAKLSDGLPFGQMPQYSKEDK